MKDEGKDVTVISALDDDDEDKVTDEVLDIMFRQRYKDLGISFLSIADLRKEDLRKKEASSNYIYNQFRRLMIMMGLNSSILFKLTLHLKTSHNPSPLQSKTVLGRRLGSKIY